MPYWCGKNMSLLVGRDVEAAEEDGLAVGLDVACELLALAAIVPGVHIFFEFSRRVNNKVVKAVRRIDDGKQGRASEGFLDIFLERSADASEESVEGRGTSTLGQLGSELRNVAGGFSAVVAVCRGDPSARGGGPLGTPDNHEVELDLRPSEESGEGGPKGLAGSKARGLVQKVERRREASCWGTALRLVSWSSLACRASAAC
jgi:hypothetical protein